MSSANPRPLLTLHVGQAGIQIGHAAWELMCLEHNIEPDGNPKPHCEFNGNLETVFIPTPQGKHFPRTIFVDTDPGCVDEVRSGPYSGLFSPRQLLSDQMDAGTNYTTGRYSYAKKLLPDTVDRMRWMTEKTDFRPTVILKHSACGGTGSGFAVACLSRAADELGLTAQNVLDFCIVPGRMATQSSSELLNTALYLDESQDLVRQTFCLSNSALFRVCASQLQSNGGATYAHANRVIAAAFSNLTATERFPGSNVSLTTILDSLLPFQHLKYPLLACAPFLTTDTARTDRPTAKAATSAVLETGSQFLDIDPRKGRHAAGFLLYRGDAGISETHKLATELTQRNRVQFYDWAPAGFRTGSVTAPPVAPPGSGFADSPISVTMVTSHSGVSATFADLAAAARRLHDRDMFVHNYEGAIVALLSRGGIGAGANQTTDRRGSGESQPAVNAESTTDTNPVDTAAGSSVEAPLGSESNSVRTWMAPTFGRRAGHSELQLQQELQQHSRRRAPYSDPQGQEEPVSRTYAISDVFGVRGRLGVAIEYLERVSGLYSEDAMGEPGGGDSVEPAAAIVSGTAAEDGLVAEEDEEGSSMPVGGLADSEKEKEEEEEEEVEADDESSVKQYQQQRRRPAAKRRDKATVAREKSEAEGEVDDAAAPQETGSEVVGVLGARESDKAVNKWADQLGRENDPASSAPGQLPPASSSSGPDAAGRPPQGNLQEATTTEEDHEAGLSSSDGGGERPEQLNATLEASGQPPQQRTDANTNGLGPKPGDHQQQQQSLGSNGNETPTESSNVGLLKRMWRRRKAQHKSGGGGGGGGGGGHPHQQQRAEQHEAEFLLVAQRSRWSPRRDDDSSVDAGRHPAITEAERILMKYQKSLEKDN